MTDNPVLFLDIDGVLNSTNFYIERSEKHELDSRAVKWLSDLVNDIWFRDRYFRDAVMSDWENGLRWDDIFDTELKYPKPGAFYGVMEKVFTMNGKLYNEKDGESLKN